MKSSFALLVSAGMLLSYGHTSMAASPDGVDHGVVVAQASAAPTHTGQGTVKAIDMAGLKVKLDHGPIASLKWPGMTMDFRVQEKNLLEGIQPGVRVEFQLTQDKSRGYVISQIKPVK